MGVERRTIKNAEGWRKEVRKAKKVRAGKAGSVRQVEKVMCCRWQAPRQPSLYRPSIPVGRQEGRCRITATFQPPDRPIRPPPVLGMAPVARRSAGRCHEPPPPPARDTRRQGRVSLAVIETVPWRCGRWRQAGVVKTRAGGFQRARRQVYNVSGAPAQGQAGDSACLMWKGGMPRRRQKTPYRYAGVFVACEAGSRAQRWWRWQVRVGKCLCQASGNSAGGSMECRAQAITKNPKVPNHNTHAAYLVHN